MNTGELDILLVGRQSGRHGSCPTCAATREIGKPHLRDGEEALDFSVLYAHRAFDRPPKMVMLDLKLPKVDGLEVLKQLKGDSRTKNIPIVITTSSREERDMVSGYDLGANSYIQKPVDIDQFRETVKYVGLYRLVVNQPPISGVREMDATRP
jgi:two-component system response regulator